MAVNYEDERFQQVETEKQNALSEIEKTYSGLIDQSDAFYQNQIEASKQWEEQQKELQQQQTDFALQQIEQQKEQERKNYIREQSGAYADWQKQSDQYGANAEKLAAAGMANTGFGESSQVAMYNAYQGRVAMARENYQGIIQDYNNAMTEARLQNNAALAQIAFESMQQRLELELQNFLHKSQLELDLLGKKQETEQIFHSRYQDVLAQINQENALAEQIRQHNATLAEQQRQFNASLAEEQRQFDVANSGSNPGSAIIGGSITGSTGSGSKTSASGNNAAPNTYEKNASAAKYLKNKAYGDNISRGNTATANRLVNTLSSQKKANIPNSILTYVAQGKLNVNEAAYLLDYFGLNVSVYLK